MFRPKYINSFLLSSVIFLTGSPSVYAQMAGIKSNSAPPTSKSKVAPTKGLKPTTPARDPNDDSFNAGASYSPYPNVQEQSGALKVVPKPGLTTKPQQPGALKTTPQGAGATPPWQSGMPPVAPQAGNTTPPPQVAAPQSVKPVSPPAQTQSNRSNPSSPGQTPLTQAGTGTPPQSGTPQSQPDSTATQQSAPQPATTQAGPATAPPTSASKAATSNTSSKQSGTSKAASKTSPATKLQSKPGKTEQTQLTKTAPPSGTTSTAATPQTGSPPTGVPNTSPQTGAVNGFPQNPQYAGQPYPPQYQQYPPQGYPAQYPYNAPYRPQQGYPGQPYPYQTQPYSAYPGSTPAYQGSPYPGGTPGHPGGVPAYPPSTPQQSSYPAGAAEPFSTLKRPGAGQAPQSGYPGYPAQQQQYPAQQAYPQQWQQPYYPPQYAGQPPGQQFYQPQNYPTGQQPNYPSAQPQQNPAPAQSQSFPSAQQTQPVSSGQPPVSTTQQQPAQQLSAPNNPTKDQASTGQATQPQTPQAASAGGASAPAKDNMTEFLANVTAARQMISSGNPAFAVDSLDKAVKLRPRNLSVYFYRGLAYDESGDPSKAVKNYLESLDRAKTVGMDSAELRTNLGNSYMKLNFFDDAIVEYQRAIDIEPASGAAHMQLGRALLSKGDYTGALKSLRKSETLGFNDPSMPYLKALCLAALKQKQEALTELAPLLTTECASRSPQLNKLAEDLKNDLKTMTAPIPKSQSQRQKDK